MDVTIIATTTNLVREVAGLTDHKTLAPASARYARRQTMWGGQASPTRRERFRTAKITEITASAGQKILFSGWGVVRSLCMSARDEIWGLVTAVAKFNSGDIIVT
jgi:hypothetical protein